MIILKVAVNIGLVGSKEVSSKQRELEISSSRTVYILSNKYLELLSSPKKFYP